VLGGLSLWMLINGLLVRAAMHSLGLDSCHPLTASKCLTLLQTFQSEGYQGTANTFAGVLLALPGLIGVFVGGPLLARELETGTSRFAWTQGCGRLRWIISKLVPLAVLVTAGAAAVSLVTTWYTQTFVAAGMASVIRPTLFDVRGVDFAAWTLAAFAIATFAGLVIRRTVPAMVTAAGAWAGLFLVTTVYLRKHYEAPLILKWRDVANPPSWSGGMPWVVGQFTTGPGGDTVSQSEWSAAISRMQAALGPIRPGEGQRYFAWLTRQGYVHWFSYQPASRFWPFQFIEGGWLLALGLLLGAATVWLVRRRTA
jgi:uncharacterized Tic20 family protein